LFFSGFVLLLIAGMVAAQSTPAKSAVEAICEVLANITFMLFMITAAVGIVVIVLQGIKWAGSAEDPGARKSAKQGIIHAVVGMIIVLLAVWIVALVFGDDRCDIAGVLGP
jgi:heme/copper-type cytochrome/quinol oxidase subunit 2